MAAMRVLPVIDLSGLPHAVARRSIPQGERLFPSAPRHLIGQCYGGLVIVGGTAVDLIFPFGRPGA